MPRFDEAQIDGPITRLTADDTATKRLTLLAEWDHPGDACKTRLYVGTASIENAFYFTYNAEYTSGSLGLATAFNQDNPGRPSGIFRCSGATADIQLYRIPPGVDPFGLNEATRRQISIGGSTIDGELLIINSRGIEGSQQSVAAVNYAAIGVVAFAGGALDVGVPFRFSYDLAPSTVTVPVTPNITAFNITAGTGLVLDVTAYGCAVEYTTTIGGYAYFSTTFTSAF